MVPSQPVFQRLSFEELHDDEGLAIEFANIVDGADVRMVERVCSARFSLETFERLPVLCEVFRQELERYEAPEPRVLGLVDDPHATATKPFHDPVMSDRLANQIAESHARGIAAKGLLAAQSCAEQ